MYKHINQCVYIEAGVHMHRNPCKTPPATLSPDLHFLLVLLKPFSFFYQVLKKALTLEQIVLATEACKDVLSSLHRRHETLAENYALISKLPGGVAVQGEDTRKFGAAVIEFTQNKKKRGLKK